MRMCTVYGMRMNAMSAAGKSLSRCMNINKLDKTCRKSI